MHKTAVNTKTFLRRIVFAYGRRAAGLLVLLSMINGLYMAAHYTTAMMGSLQKAVPAMAEFDVQQANEWHADDATHVVTLQQRWPWSLPEVVGEIALFWHQQRTLQHEGIVGMRGYRIVPAGLAGKQHAVAAAIGERLGLIFPLAGRRQNTRALFAGYPLDVRPGSIPVHPDDVEALLDPLPLPDGVFRNLEVVLLPYALQQAAGLGGAGHAIIGAAPGGDAGIHPDRTAYAVLHELGHHIHFRYIDSRRRSAAALWHAYMEIRGIQTSIASGSVNTDAWSLSARETFAEDFRLLFGPVPATTVPHGTKFGDPRITPRRAADLYDFIIDLVADS